MVEEEKYQKHDQLEEEEEEEEKKEEEEEEEKKSCIKGLKGICIFTSRQYCSERLCCVCVSSPNCRTPDKH